MGGVIEDVAFVEVCDVEDLWIGEMRTCDVNGARVLLVNVGGAPQAYADACPHQGVSLGEGEFDGRKLICRAHRWAFDAGTGRGINPPRACLRRYPVRIVEGKILVGDREVDDRK